MKLNFTNFTRKEKILFAITLIGLTAFFAAFIHKYFLADVRQLPFDWDREIKRMNTNLILILIFFIGGMSAVWGHMFLTRTELFSFKPRNIDEFEILKGRESSQISALFFWVIIVTILFLFHFDRNFADHVYYSHNRAGEEYYLKAVNNINYRAENLEHAREFSKSEARLDVMLGMNFIIVPWAISQILASLIVWLKYR